MMAKELTVRRWIYLLLFALVVHAIYAGFVVVAAGSLAAKKGAEIVFTAMKLDNIAKFLTPSVLDLAFEQVVFNEAESQIAVQRALAAEQPHTPMPEAYRSYRGRGLLSDDDVIDVSAMETQVQNANFGMVPEAVEFPEEVDNAPNSNPEIPPPPPGTTR